MKILFIFLSLLGFSLSSQAADFPGSKDHPILSRFPGSEIKWLDVQAYAPYFIGAGPIVGYQKIEKWEEVKGRYTRIYYELEGVKTHSEVFLNYKKALEDEGFINIAEGLFPQSNRTNEVGSRKWLGTHYKRNEPPSAGIRLLQGSSTSGGTAYLAMKKDRSAGPVYVVIGISQYSQDIITTMIDVIEIEEAETGLISINAEAIGKDIHEYGRVILDGLFFEHDKAILKPESNEALAEIALFLKTFPALNFYVVGHTDATGSFSYNQTLSRARANAVKKELTEKYGIAQQRLDPHGVGPLLPVFSNATDVGRKKNRRVELVEKP